MADKNHELWKFAGLGAQIFMALGISVYLGHLADSRWLNFSIPLATVLLPLIVLFAIIYNVVKQTSKKK